MLADKETADQTITVHLRRDLLAADHLGSLRSFIGGRGAAAAHCDPRWIQTVCDGLSYPLYLLLAQQTNRVVGVLPLALVTSRLFGSFLVSLPYVNWGGVSAETETVGLAIIDRAVELADELDVRHLEFRHEMKWDHPALTKIMDAKVNMRLALAGSMDDLWQGLRPVVRTQIRKAQKLNLQTRFGGDELLDDYYRVFAQNMRDLGTPVYGKRLFQAMLGQFGEDAELSVVYQEKIPIASGIAVHGIGVTEVPSASALRKYRDTACNSLMYWALIQRSMERGQPCFDFGRSTIGSGTYQFKKKWGAKPSPTAWQYYVRKGEPSDMRPDGGKYDRMIQIWQRLPVWLTRRIGPYIVRGIP